MRCTSSLLAAAVAISGAFAQDPDNFGQNTMPTHYLSNYHSSSLATSPTEQIFSILPVNTSIPAVTTTHSTSPLDTTIVPLFSNTTRLTGTVTETTGTSRTRLTLTSTAVISPTGGAGETGEETVTGTVEPSAVETDAAGVNGFSGLAALVGIAGMLVV